MPIEENDMINMRAKMSGFIFPNVPISDFERAAFEQKLDFFEEIYGIRPVLKQKRRIR